MKATLKEFQEFLLKQNALALAVGVIIGAAIGNVVTGIVQDILMPIIGTVVPSGGEWKAWRIPLHGSNALAVGDLLDRVLNFIIVAGLVFAITKLLLKEKPKPVTTRSCPECLETIPLAARRCRACATAL